MSQSGARVKKCWLLVLSVIILWLAIAVLVFRALEHQDQIAYSRDDAYIQMAIAKNVVENGSWGINPGEFSSTSSSPLWVVLLTGIYLVAGVNDLAPFILNIIFVTLAVVILFLIMQREGIDRRAIFLILTALTLFAPLPPLVLLGMEHSLQIAFALLFVYLAALALSRGRQDGGAPAKWLLALAPAVVACRFESIFLVVVVVLLMLFARRWLQALALGALGLAPILIYGAYSLANGGMFVPNPLPLKANIPLTPFGNWITGNIKYIPDNIESLASNPLFLVLSLASAFVLLMTFIHRGDPRWDRARTMNIILLVSIFLHFQTNTSQNFRYEAYLVAIGIMAISIPLFQYLAGRSLPAATRERALLIMAAAPLALVLLAPFVHRGLVNHRLAPLETRRIYEQQINMAKFLDRYYTGEVVAANDIGAINFYADIECVDLWGLGTNEVAKERLRVRGGALFDIGFVLSEEKIDEITKESGTDIAMVYHEIYEVDGESHLPDEWVLVGRWQFYRYDRDYWDKVSIYAVDPAQEEQLIGNLREFAPELPDIVKQEGRYTEGL